MTETIDYVLKQKELEDHMLQAGVDRYYERLSIRGVDSGIVGQRVVSVMTETFAAELKATLDHIVDPKRRGRPSKEGNLVRKLSKVNPGALALLTVRTVLQACGDSRSTNQVANKIGLLVAEHDDWMVLSSKSKGLAYVVRKNLKTTNHEDHRRKVVRHVVTKYSESSWTEEERGKAGMWLLKECIRVTEMAKIVVKGSVKQRRSYVEATAKTQAMLVEGHIRCDELTPIYTPMVCPPQPWSDAYTGGYLSHRMPIIKTRDREYLKRLADADMPQVLDAMNTLQETAYRVNKAVLGVIRRAIKANDQLPGLVDQEDMPLPAKPADVADGDKEAFKAWKARDPIGCATWKREAAIAHAHNATIYGERIALSMKLNTAEKFADYPELYFPHQLDWRGRAYPVPVFLNPQGDDMAKALLHFAEGKVLGEEGVMWLKIHTANLFGVDKVGFGERIKWVDDNMDQLIEAGTSPETSDFWLQADKPWQALAACFELVGVAIQGEDYVSHLPVAMDGSCNGLQHLSAMLRDETGGASVNLIPADVPADIYTEVQKKVIAKLEVIDDKRAEYWLDMGVNRKLVKRPVMTTPYGVTGFGIRDQLKGEIDAQGLLTGKRQRWMVKATDTEEKATYYAASFIAPVIKEAISETVLASQAVMDWFRDVGSLAGKAGVPVKWTSPIGLPAQSNYWKPKGKPVQAFIGGVKVDIWLAQDSKTLNVQKMANGMSPNVVHSYDGAHMMATVNACTDKGITSLAMVHDSYATHACDVGEMSILLREKFVEMYSGDVLNELYHQFMDQVPADVELPHPPTPGNLDLNQVLDSLYFFA